MARIKHTSRKKTTKRLPLAVMPHKSSKNSDVKIEKGSNSKEVKETSTEVARPSSSLSSPCHMQYYFTTTDPLNSKVKVAGIRFIEEQTDKMQGLPENAGKWLLFSNTEHCDLGGPSHHNYAWNVAKALVKDFKNTGIISAKFSHFEDSEDSEHGALGTVCCYTSNYKDKLAVKRAADAIFKAYPYPLSMYYKTEKNVLGNVCDRYKKKVVAIYKYTIENKFYERCASDSYNWQLVEFENEVAPGVKENVPQVSYREVMPCIITTHQWLYISSLEQNCERFVVSSTNYVENLPDTAGKWLLFNSFSDVCPLAGVSHHDFAWKSLKHLVINYKNSKVIAVKCSTNRIDATNPNKGVTCCYTPHFYDKLTIEIAAKAIRDAFHYPDIMYYKTEEDSESGICSQHGNTHISIFRHTPDGKLYEREGDQLSWKLLD
ncbi:uncharacterized protein [Parasteatoda tepidariorum]|nr:uncharacterized protein LOC107442632 isoform X2 [Parasteatoda tepidariorum]XP_042898238.1 uncharacterized protein LOC107442632 isoform X2 [Parasteatoda tepidariorum]XP_042898239.1 uncharacterized protein LOC107442632 isoform X2 [Parasteatoda tepidariorum]XP_042898240.1 uncharacterized protein LOC107442632 isoform X2 [Parasteatoda tepidariorum]